MEQESLSANNSQNNNRSISIQALGRKTRNAISILLNPIKIIPSDKGLPRDWQGLAELCGISGEKIPSLKEDPDPSNKVLDLWCRKEENASTIDRFVLFLEELDRFDIIEDITPLIQEDIEFYKQNPNGFKVNLPDLDDKDILTTDDVIRKRQGLEPQTYDAFVLFADDDIDFATELIETLENRYNLKICVKDRDLVGGAFEHDSIIQLISSRCRRLIVIVSPSFLESAANKFFCSFAQVQGIEQRKRKIIPCLYKPCENLPADLRIYFLLDYVRSKKFCNFWDKLYSSITASPMALEDKSSLNNSLETLKPINNVKFNSMVNLNSCTSPTIITDEKITPSTSDNSLECYPEKLKKRRSFYKRLKNIVKPKSTTNHQPEQEKEKVKVVEAEKEKRKFWKSNKVKIAVAN